MKVIALGGMPAIGKSTIMRHVLARLEDHHDSKFVHKKWHHLTYGMDLEGTNLMTLGRYLPDDPFPGTDKLALDSMPYIRDWIRQNSEQDITILFEGDRLYSNRMLEFFYRYPITKRFYMITAEEAVLAGRRDGRDHVQTAKFLEGRQTKYANMLKHPAFDIKVVENNCDSDMHMIIEEVVGEALS